MSNSAADTRKIERAKTVPAQLLRHKYSQPGNLGVRPKGIRMILRLATFALLLSFANLATASGARIIYTYADTSVEKKPIALLSQEPPDTDSMCRHRIADVVVSGISYNESSGMIDGFSALSTGKGASKKYWNLFTIGMDKRQMVDLSRLLQTRTNLIVLYTVCGAGDFHEARELWLKNAVNIP